MISLTAPLLSVKPAPLDSSCLTKVVRNVLRVRKDNTRVLVKDNQILVRSITSKCYTLFDTSSYFSSKRCLHRCGDLGIFVVPRTSQRVSIKYFKSIDAQKKEIGEWNHRCVRLLFFLFFLYFFVYLF